MPEPPVVPAPKGPAPPRRDALAALRDLAAAPGRAGRLTHVELIPQRLGATAEWPSWVHPELVSALRRRGIDRLWAHQALAAETAWSGRSVVLATGTASGKSLAYLLPALSATLSGSRPPSSRPADSRSAGIFPETPAQAPPAGPDALSRAPSTLYVAPTKALAADQLRVVRGLGLEPVRASTYDGDTPTEERDWIRRHATYVLTNPDMLHHSLLPGHARWGAFLRSLEYVVIDECHHYRGVFGSHVATIIRRLRRICARYGSAPTFVLASATVSDPASSAGRLVGCNVFAVDGDTSARGETVFGLWEPPLTQLRGEGGAPVRRSASAEVADLLTDLVVAGLRTVVFVRSRRAAEAVSLTAKRLLDEVEPGLSGRVAAYRSGYLPEERRDLERRLQTGELLGVASTNALELGVDIAGLDAVLLAGYPGTRASMWQQAGRAGRTGSAALAVLVGRDDPLDTYLTHHPEMLFGRPVESTVFDADNPYVLAPHLCAAAAELPLTAPDLALFGPAATDVADHLVERALLRRRTSGLFWTRRDRPTDLADLRGAGGHPVRLAELATGRLLGTVDPSAAHSTAHAGAVYVHQGETYLVRTLDLDSRVAMLERAEPDYSTFARDITDLRVLETSRSISWGEVLLSFGTVRVTNQVVAFLRKQVATGEVLGEERLDLPQRVLQTRAVWWTASPAVLQAAGIGAADVPGAAHAAEHASISLLPLFASCDRWDIGGVSTAMHEDTGAATVFVYDGHPGGAGFAERGFGTAAEWLSATRDAVAVCECASGCPSCVQSPKCGNGNDPLDKSGSVRLLGAVLLGSHA